jgi:hypothetical protein
LFGDIVSECGSEDRSARTDAKLRAERPDDARRDFRAPAGAITL